MKRILLFVVAVMCVAIGYAQNTSPLCFTARNGSVTMRFDIKNVTHTIQYSTDGTSWSTYTSYPYTSYPNVTINANQSIYFRAATDQTSATAFGNSSYSNSSRFYFSSSNGGTVESSGNIMSLYGPSCPDLPLQKSAFAFIFYGCSLLTTAPALPATTLSDSCYVGMFENCTSLTAAPALPATTLADYCYFCMFNGCTSLTAAPALPATTLANRCYEYMFSYCRSLTAAPTLPATTLTDLCYRGMFRDCTSLASAPALPATTLDISCYAEMFWDCSSLTTAPALPVTTLATGCYYAMFTSCTSLTAVPELPATTMTNSCYSMMFFGCTSLTTAPSLPATTLADGCYYCMFYGCTSLTTAPALPVTTLATGCYQGMFSRCTSLTRAPTLPATTVTNDCYREMFSECRSLTTVPTLTATTLAERCYQKMFYSCSSLRINTSSPGKPWRIPATSTATNALTDMFTGTYGTMNGTPNINTTYYIASCNQYNVSVNTNDTTIGSISGTGIYYDGDNVVLTATPIQHHHFSRWSDGNTTNPRYVTVTSDSSFTAIFEIDTHTVTVNASHGTATGAGSYAYNSIATLTATPNAHYHFARWSDGNTANPRSIIVTSNKSLTAIFEIDKHTISANATNGTVAGTGSYAYHSVATLMASPNVHYHFARWSDGITANPRYVAVASDSSFTAIFEINSYIISANDSNGSVTGTGTYVYNTIATLTATPNEHYHVRWPDSDTSRIKNYTVTGDTTFTSVFEIDKHTITAYSEYGTVTGVGTYDYGSTIALTAEKGNHYHFARWSDGDTTNPRYVTVACDSLFTAIFEIDKHTISASGSNGTVYGGGLYDYNSVVELTAVPDVHYNFSHWSDGDTTNPRSIIVLGDTTYTAIYEAKIYDISVNGQNGTVNGAGPYRYETTATLSAVADKHYHFARWSDGDTTNPRYVNVVSDSSFTAVFEIDKHNVAVDATNGSVEGTGSFDYGSIVELTAIPDDHYCGAIWWDGDTSMVKNITLLSDTTLSVSCTKCKYVVSATCEHGTITGDGVYEYGDVATLEVFADEGYSFVVWSDSISFNPRVFVVEEDVDLEAICEEVPVVGVENVDGGVLKFHIVGNDIINPSNELIRVYSASGQLIKESNGDIDMRSFPAGVYMVVDERGNGIKMIVNGQ